MGRFRELQRETRAVEARLSERRQRTSAHISALKTRVRERYSVAALLVAGVALGVAVDQYLRHRANKPQRRRSTQRAAAVSAALPLVSTLQFLATTLLAPRPERARPPVIVPAVQSERSTSLADRSSSRTGNGLSRH